MKINEIIESIDKNGWAKIESVYNVNQINEVLKEAELVLPFYERLQSEAGLGDSTINSTHHTALICESVMNLINPNPTHELLETFFNGKYILNTMGVAFCQPNEGYNYTMKIHRDIRSYSSSNRLFINTIILLDDSTEENGATHMIYKESNVDYQPSEDFFNNNSFRICGKRGDIILFDGNMWHKAGVNYTNKPRRIISQMFTVPFIKQQLDYPRALGMDFKHKIPSQLSQILGYNAMTPKSLNEFYQPKEKRFYKNDQG